MHPTDFSRRIPFRMRNVHAVSGVFDPRRFANEEKAIETIIPYHDAFMTPEQADELISKTKGEPVPVIEFIPEHPKITERDPAEEDCGTIDMECDDETGVSEQKNADE